MSGPAASRPVLTARSLGADPLQAFQEWLDDADEHGEMSYANAMILSTVTAEEVPDGRVVLLKGVDARGFLFFTNYRSEKGRALEANPRAALTFYWDALGRQVRVRGRVEPLSGEESDAYFASRPRGSQLGAWASEQSRPLEERGALEDRLRELEARFADSEVPRPPHWGGYLVRPEEIEFWQAGRYRLHDRFVFRRTPGGWSVSRLSP